MLETERRLLVASKAAFYHIVGLQEAHAVEGNGWKWHKKSLKNVHPVAELLRSAIERMEHEP